MTVEDTTAQDVVDALRFALMAQKDPAEGLKLAKVLLEFAPETESDRGIHLIMGLIAEGAMKVEMTE